MADFTFSTAVYSATFFLLLLVCVELGRRFGKRLVRADPDLGGNGTIDAALFGVLGLIIAFTFSGAAGRFDDRRKLIVDETNMIGTAYLRVDLLPEESRPAVKEKFRQYVDSRIRAFRGFSDSEAFQAEQRIYTQLQSEIWVASVEATRGSDWTPAAMLLIPALNEMFDITTTRTMSARMHPPRVIFIMLIFVSLIAAVLAGFASASSPQRSWIHILAFTLTLATIFYVIVDLEFPRLGLITIDAFDQALIDLRKSMN